jgi:tetratricopeptide (TPR) repeat protein
MCLGYLRVLKFLSRVQLQSFFLVGLFFLGAGHLSPACAQSGIELQRVQIEQDVNMVRIVLGFDRMPLHELSTSGQKVEVRLLDTYVDQGLSVPEDNESIARILIGEGSNHLLLSFLLRRPPAHVNAVQRKHENEIEIEVFWRRQDEGMRPAISRSLPGGIHIGPVGGVSRRVIASKYRGNWEQFFLDYEREVELEVPLRYTYPPFPALGLYLPAADLIPLEVQQAGAASEWEIARNGYSGAVFDNLFVREEQVRNLVLADISLREGRCSAARGYLHAFASVAENREKSTERQDSTGDEEFWKGMQACADLLGLYCLSCGEKHPYALLAELTLSVSADSDLGKQPYVTLLQAEAELAAGRSEIALQLLEDLKNRELEPPGVVLRREADARAAQGDADFALRIYPQLDEEGLLDGAPYSLGRYARILYANKKYTAAQQVFSRLYDMVETRELRDLVRYFQAKSLLHSGDSDAALKILDKIMPGSRASRLARLKIADLGAAGSDIESRRQALADYVRLYPRMPTREGKAEVQFKQGLTYHLLQQTEQAVATLRDFLHRDRVSSLRPYAQALLAEILPPYVERLIAEERYFDAMLLVEQNRDILVATQRSYDFLLHLGQVFRELEFYPRAVKLYQYVMDATGDEDKLEPVYLPLIEALYARGDYRSVVKYARGYLEQFGTDAEGEAGSRVAQIYLAYVRALLQLEREDEARELLRAAQRPRSAALDRFAARYFWQRNEPALAGKQLQHTVEEGNADAQDIFMYAESLYSQEKYAAAFDYYKQVSDVDEFRLPAQYRMGTILVEQGERERGLTFLTRVAESNGDSPWKRLAQQSLLIQRLD